jgi:CBS domain containing-hemolysin-like protein
VNELLVLGVLVLASGLFSSSETALVSLSLGRAESLCGEKRRGAEALLFLKRHPTQMLVTILIGNNLANIGASALATVLSIRYFEEMGPGLAVGALTLIILVFGEITPKSMASHQAERLSLLFSPLILLLYRLFFVLVWPLTALTHWLHRLGGMEKDPIVTESELINMAGHGEVIGVIEADERAMIERIFNFNDLVVEDVMTPRNQIFMVDGRLSIDEVMPSLLSESFSRVPVFSENPDDVGKILYLRDVLEAVTAGKGSSSVKEFAHEAMFVPLNQPIDELFKSLRTRRLHMALVVDEYGSLQGLVTLEDLLEELVGEIYDESDDRDASIKDLGDGRISVSGTTELREIEEFFQIALPGKPTDTVSWWVLSHTERIPASGEEFRIDCLKVTIEKASKRMIAQLILQPVTGSDAP